jgi:hypothetical protein
LDAISIVRNLIVHTGGIIDENYLKRAGDLPPDLVGPLGTAIKRDGVVVSGLVGATIKIGQDFILAVDSWLARE